VFHRIGHILLITALLAATGGHWALLQTVAWTNMLAANLETCPLSEALARTFDGRHPCRLCKQIAAGKQSEKKAGLSAPVKKFEFTHTATRFGFAAPAPFRVTVEPRRKLLSLNRTPPVPPPRAPAG
jgi:hypothetical protein